MSTEHYSPFYGESYSVNLQNSDKQLLLNGGFVPGKRVYVWRKMSWYYKTLVIVALLSLLFLIVISFSSSPSKDTEWYSWGWVTAIAAIFLYFSYWLGENLKERGFWVRPINNKVPQTSLGTTNRIGVTLWGSYRSIGETYVSYQVVAVKIPILIIGCYRVHVDSFFEITDKTTTTFRIYGSEKWNIFEVLHIYLSSYSVATLILCGIWFLALIF